MSAADDQAFMARALELARLGIASTDPNPSVGCVIVQAGAVVGEGFTRPAGGHHAEIEALSAAAGDAQGATVYVSLEPCVHTGRTGPCTEALIAAGVARVVFALEDPNPAVAGRGAQRLRDAGIAVESPLLSAEAEAINCGFVTRMRLGRPWIRCKMAASLDGRTALANGQSQWITGIEARRDVQRWRAQSSAVMTGIGTVLADDPSLNARPEACELKLLQPKRIIVDSGLRTPPGARTLTLAGEVIIFSGGAVATTAGSAVATASATASTSAVATTSAGSFAARRIALEQAGARVESVPGEPRCDLAAVVRRLAELEINSVWLEAGPVLAGAMLAAGLVDELVLYFAPGLLGNAARGLFDLPAMENLDQRIRLVIDDVSKVGDDLRLIARPEFA